VKRAGMYSNYRKIIVSAALILLVWCFNSAVNAEGTEQYKLGPGDQLRVTVFEEPDLSGEFQVGTEGEIALPLIGSVLASGKSLRELVVAIETALLDGFLISPKVNIEVLNHRPFYILGEVYEPGSYAYVSGMTVLNAVALGGGFTHRADKKKITIIRGAGRAKTSSTVSPESVVLPGDMVRVEERFF